MHLKKQTKIMQDTTGKSLGVLLGTDEKCIEVPQMRKLKSFGEKLNRFGVNFAVFDVNSKPALLCDKGKFHSDFQQLADLSRRALEYAAKREQSEAENRVQRFGDRRQILAVVLKTANTPAGVAVIDAGDMPHSVQTDFLGYMLELLAEDFSNVAMSEKQIEMISTELAHVYEELVLLHKLSTSMKVTESDANFLQMACDNLTDIVSVEGIAVLLEKTIDDEKRMVLAAGSGLIDIDDRMAAVLHHRLIQETNSGKECFWTARWMRRSGMNGRKI